MLTSSRPVPNGPGYLSVHLARVLLPMIVAMDSETQDGFAILLTKPWSFAEPESFEDCIEFLRVDKEMAWWNADYDVQAVIKWLPLPIRNRVALLNEVRYGEYLIRYVPNKFAKVWKGDGDQQDLLFTIYDLRQFYNCSLRRAAEKLGVQQKKDFPRSWYRQMLKKLKDPRTRSPVLDYAMGDAQTLQAIIRKTEESFKLAGLKFERPFSNAVFAERFFRKQFRYRRKIEVEKIAQKAYHGGRIECLRVGHFPRAYYYDIHSAYPSIIAALEKPDGRWIHERNGDPSTVREDCRYGFFDCEFDIPRDSRVGPIPFRLSRGGLLYPVGRFRKTITLSEFNFLSERRWVSKVYASWLHIWTSGKRPFSAIEELYRKRKTDPRIDYAFKIVMNSVYGKLAQVLEHLYPTNVVDYRTEFFDERIWRKRIEWKEHTSFVYAAEITAQIRMKLLRDIPPEDVILYATDGVFTTKPVKLTSGKGLGEWSEPEEVHNLCVVGSGVYQYEDKDGEETIRFRGFSPDIALATKLYAAGNRHAIRIDVTRNTSLKLAARLPERRNRMNVLEEEQRLLDVNFDRKRNWEKRWTARELTSRSFDSKPWVYYGRLKLPMFPLSS